MGAALLIFARTSREMGNCPDRLWWPTWELKLWSWTTYLSLERGNWQEWEIVQLHRGAVITQPRQESADCVEELRRWDLPEMRSRAEASHGRPVVRAQWVQCSVLWVYKREEEAGRRLREICPEKMGFSLLEGDIKYWDWVRGLC